MCRNVWLSGGPRQVTEAATQVGSRAQRTAVGPACHAVRFRTLSILSYTQVLLNKHIFKKKNTPVFIPRQVKWPSN